MKFTVSPYDSTKPVRYKIVSFWSGIVFEEGRVFDDSEEAWKVADEINKEISADVIAVVDDGRGMEIMEKFYPAPRSER